MKKEDITKIIVSVGVIIILAVIVINVNKLIPPTVPKNIVQEPTTQTTGETLNYGECFSGYGKEATTVVFVHSNYCPHCKNMVPIIRDLESEGYKFYWAESSDNQAREIVSNCFSDLLSGYVPQFICPKTGEEKTGEMSKDVLKRFADICAQ